MNKNTTITLLVGMPASGKSTWAENNAKNMNATIISSDRLRDELFGDVNNQDNNVNLFEELFRRAKTLLDCGNNVIIDATNVSQKRRIHFNKEFKKYTKNVVYFNTPFHLCVMNDNRRDRKVGHKVIKKMYHNLQVPTYAEGWDDVKIIYNEYYSQLISLKAWEYFILDLPEYDELYAQLMFFREFDYIHELGQDNPHHTFSVSRHIYYVYQDIFYKYQESEREELIKMLWVALFHDIGKGVTKTFINMKGEEKRYASFYSHEFVSAQNAVSILHSIGYDDDFILDVAELVQLHMKLLNASDKSKKKLLNFVGEDKFRKLECLSIADSNAK